MNAMYISEITRTLRPQQWTKNLFVFAALIFSLNITNFPLVLLSIAGFFIFCVLSGAAYILNDLRDFEDDKKHPLKSQRPIASGRLKKDHALYSFIFFGLMGLILAFLINFYFFLAALAYLVIQIAYSLFLKHVVILDVFIIAGGFLFRVVAGGVAIDVYLSPWLLICTFLLALFLALSKRRHELILLEEAASSHRPILSKYSTLLLDQMIAVVTASTIITYCLYTISEETVAKFGSTSLIFTLPFVIYGIFRYLYLVYQRTLGGNPESHILRDKPLLLDLLFWAMAVILILYA